MHWIIEHLHILNDYKLRFYFLLASKLVKLHILNNYAFKLTHTISLKS